MKERRWRWPVVVVGGVLALAALTACTSASRKRLTEVLFDDPPSRRPPVAPAAAPVRAPSRPRTVPALPRWAGSSHGPFAAQLCAACHTVDSANGRVSTSSGSLLLHPRQELCFKCHGTSLLPESARRDGAALHGPVAAGLCLACHDPHRTRQPFLLRVPREEVCSRCHEPASLLSEHPVRDRSCPECHNPHAPGWSLPS